MTPGQITGAVIAVLLWAGLIYFVVTDRIQRRKVNAPLYKVDRCGMCHGSGSNPAREGYRGHGEPCPACRGTGKVVRHPGSSSAAGPAPRGAEVGSFIGGPVW